MQAAAGYPAMDPRPDASAQRVLAALLDRDAGSDKEPDDETRACYTLVEKIVGLKLASESLLLDTLDASEKALVASCLEMALSTSDVFADENSDEEILQLITKFRAAGAARSLAADELNISAASSYSGSYVSRLKTDSSTPDSEGRSSEKNKKFNVTSCVEARVFTDFEYCVYYSLG